MSAGQMRPAAILETCLYASDLDAAERFYGGILGLERVTRVGERHVFYRLPGQMLLIFNPAESRKPPAPDGLPVPPHGVEGEGHLCFSIAPDSLPAWRAHLEANGVACEALVDWSDDLSTLYVRDPAGNSIEFTEPRLWGFPAVASQGD